jgi:hypothetical protein
MAAVAVLTLGTSAMAADPLPTEIALARRLFSDARTAEDAKDWPTAVSKLRDAISIKETPGLRFHLAYCEEQQGMLVEALVDYERADDLSMDKNDEFRAQIPGRRTSLQKRIPTVTLLFARDPATAQLTIDRHALPSTSFGKPIPLNPGKPPFRYVAGLRLVATELSLNETDAVVTDVVLVPEGRPTSVDIGRRNPSMGPVSTSRAAKMSSPTRTYVLVGEAAVAARCHGGRNRVHAARYIRRRTGGWRSSQSPGANANEKTDACVAPPKNAALCADLAAAVDQARKGTTSSRVSGFMAQASEQRRSRALFICGLQAPSGGNSSLARAGDDRTIRSRPLLRREMRRETGYSFR